ncbi:DUF4224 domain-containing protein [Corticibacter populi]|uniref:DUF4224 domain-containing protein n=1 Tax=Corticibacter populi TaxID=1550736 RepID=A0A3M6R0X7_9BURK|nr:DUF4224 domain-containing protein [Corticibacter populi]RMX08908.1 DUF4224 domain-containing protein [Corticibacter populi]
MAAFLTADEVATLTGRKSKSKQIEWLRQQGVPFRVTATGHPAVLWSAVDATAKVQAPVATWSPRVLEHI